MHERTGQPFGHDTDRGDAMRIRGAARRRTMNSPGAEAKARPTTPPLRGMAAMAWGVGGFVLMLLLGVVRLSVIALDSLAWSWHAGHWTAFVINVLFMAWCEGYRGFQCSYAPRFAARAHHLLRHATLAQAWLAPLVCMGFIDAPRRRVIGAWLLTVAIVAVVLIYRALPQPWRGILDAGVVVGLLWGAIATLYWVRRYFSVTPDVDAEMCTSTALTALHPPSEPTKNTK